ncbi:MAG TPA: response regulator [Xanthobacteraceae bacterium]|nr:response regulator [Xanthobacteraceae bacterium]
MEVTRTLPADPLPIVIVIDDDQAVCSSLKFSLELEGFSVRAYGSAAEFFNAGLIDANCLLIDQHMPGMTGMELIAKLRAQNISTPAVLIVSQPNAAVSDRATKAGVPIVEKPFLGNTLMEKIREACQPKAE